MKQILATVNFFLPSGAHDPIDELSIQSFVAQGHPCNIYSYNQPQSPIPNCDYLHAGNVLHENHYARLKHKPDYLERWFRWELIARDVGWVASTDMVCLKPLEFKRKSIFAYLDRNYVCDDLFCCNSDHTIARAMLRRYRNPVYFPFDSRRKFIAVMKALLTLRSSIARLVDTEWLSDNLYLSVCMFAHQDSLNLLAPYQFTPWRSQHFSSDENLLEHADKVPLKYSHAVKLHRKIWGSRASDKPAVVKQLRQILRKHSY